MAKIITLTNNDLTSGSSLSVTDYVTAAWELTSFTLWPFQLFTTRTIQQCHSHIKGHLSGMDTTEAAFIAYCERILLYNKELRALSTICLDPPAVWLHSDFAEGYAATKLIYTHVQTKRKLLPSYQKGILVLASGYWKYLHDPVHKIIEKIYKRLYCLREYQLLQILSHVMLQRILIT